MLLAVTPLPRPETTPPVTSTYFTMFTACCCQAPRAQYLNCSRRQLQRTSLTAVLNQLDTFLALLVKSGMGISVPRRSSEMCPGIQKRFESDLSMRPRALASWTRPLEPCGLACMLPFAPQLKTKNCAPALVPFPPCLRTRPGRESSHALRPFRYAQLTIESLLLECVSHSESALAQGDLSSVNRSHLSNQRSSALGHSQGTHYALRPWQHRQSRLPMCTLKCTVTKHVPGMYRRPLRR